LVQTLVELEINGLTARQAMGYTAGIHSHMKRVCGLFH